MTDPSGSSSPPFHGFDFNVQGAANRDSSTNMPANTSRTRQRYLATHAPPLSSSITAAVRNQTRQRVQEQAARARSAVLERARHSRSSRTNAPTPGDYQAVEEMQSIVQAHWEEFTSGFTQDEADQLDVDQLAELEAEFLRECEIAAREGMHDSYHQAAVHAPMTPQRDHVALLAAS
ncbi:hypothetical protein BCR44DRAFT_47549 [Catenaria anguillulae PL171]|uniref:Uncharacterized protein n=1 Tax=Catenaria anguillulae PL171 TaxID=765915 RepID=A0A1Y2HL95_9FUNG|nr:hypothetical protein BCR44DRAFT_47549 [Catenaria anguillulae PL171]